MWDLLDGNIAGWRDNLAFSIVNWKKYVKKIKKIEEFKTTEIKITTEKAVAVKKYLQNP